MSTMEKNEKNQAVLRLEISQEDFEKATNTVYSRTAKRYQVPGFRKGKAPRRLIEQYYGPGVFFEDAFNEAFPDVYEAAVKEHDLFPVDRPEISLADDAAEGAIAFTVTVTLKPEVTLGEYKGIKVPVHEYTVTDSEVDAELARVQDRSARMVEAERPVQEKDVVTLNYAGSVDGVPFQGGTAENQTLEIGSGNFIPGFEEQMVGMAVGEKKDLHVTFPEEYHAEELKGKEAVFAVEVLGIKEKQLPALDDEFAKDVSEFDTLEEYREDIRKKAQEQAETREKSEFDQKLLDMVCENANAEIPEVMVNRQLDYHIQNFRQRLSYQGLSFEDFLKYTGQTIEQYREMSYNDSKAAVMRELVLEAVMKAEKIEASEEELVKELEKQAEKSGKSAEELRASLTEEHRQYLLDTISFDKTVAFLRDNSEKVKAHEEEAEEPKKAKKAPKKAAAKKEEAEETGETAEEAPKKAAKKAAPKPDTAE